MRIRLLSRIVPAQWFSKAGGRDVGPLYVGKRIVQLLKEYGVTHVFGVPGGQTLPLYQGIMETEGIEHVLMRDERSAGFAADGYARLTGRTGVCDATVGPGATNLPSAIAEAYASSIPLVALVSDIPRAWEHRRVRGNASQGLRQLEIFAPITKWHAAITDESAVDDMVEHAFRVANTGRPGPVVLAIPEDVFRAPLDEMADQPARNRPLTSPWVRTAPDPESVRAAAAFVAGSRRPALLVGGGALLSGATDEVQALAEYLNAPVATTITGKGVIAETHPLAIGVAGSMGRTIANEILQEADLIIMIGTKAGQVATLGYEIPGPGVRSVHIDIDPEEIGRNFPDSQPVVGDALLAVTALTQALKDMKVGPKEWDRDQISNRVQSWYDAAIDKPQLGTEPLKPQLVMHVINQQSDPDDVVVCDASLASGWAANYYILSRSGRHFCAPRGLAGLGWGAPAAIGAALGLQVHHRPGRVILFAGDGGFAYSVQELEVMARLKLPVTTILFNNSTLAWIKHVEKVRFGDRYISSDFSLVDFATVSKGFGVPAESVKTVADLQRALEVARNTEGPIVIDIITDQWETPVVKFSSGAQAAAVKGEGL